MKTRTMIISFEDLWHNATFTRIKNKETKKNVYKVYINSAANIDIVEQIELGYCDNPEEEEDRLVFATNILQKQVKKRLVELGVALGYPNKKNPI